MYGGVERSEAHLSPPSDDDHPPRTARLRQLPVLGPGLRRPGTIAGLPGRVGRRRARRLPEVRRGPGRRGGEPRPCSRLRLAMRPLGRSSGSSPKGSDDRGRPGALAFHALLVEASRRSQGRLEPLRLRRGAPSRLVGRDDAGRRLLDGQAPESASEPADRSHEPVGTSSWPWRRGGAWRWSRPNPIDLLARGRSGRPARVGPAEGLGGDLGVRQRQPVRPRRLPPPGGHRARPSYLDPASIELGPIPSRLADPVATLGHFAYRVGMGRGCRGVGRPSSASGLAWRSPTTNPGGFRPRPPAMSRGPSAPDPTIGPEDRAPGSWPTCEEPGRSARGRRVERLRADLMATIAEPVPLSRADPHAARARPARRRGRPRPRPRPRLARRRIKRDLRRRPPPARRLRGPPAASPARSARLVVPPRPLDSARSPPIPASPPRGPLARRARSAPPRWPLATRP